VALFLKPAMNAAAVPISATGTQGIANHRQPMYW